MIRIQTRVFRLGIVICQRFRSLRAQEYSTGQGRLLTSIYEVVFPATRFGLGNLTIKPLVCQVAGVLVNRARTLLTLLRLGPFNVSA